MSKICLLGVVRIKRYLVLFAVAAVCLPGVSAHALPVCAKPVPSAPKFAPGSTNKLTWTVGSPLGGGFRLEAASEALFDADGSFKDSKIVDTATVSSSARERTFTGLPEKKFFYHLRATARTNVCTVSAWSSVVSTTQDATRPTVEFASMDIQVAESVSVPSAYRGSVTLRGFVRDQPGIGAPVASGPKAAVLRLTNTTPVAGETTEPVLPRSAETDIDGSWSATFSGLAPGQYLATATGVDGAGNESLEPDTYSFVFTA